MIRSHLRRQIPLLFIFFAMLLGGCATGLITSGGESSAAATPAAPLQAALDAADQRDYGQTVTLDPGYGAAYLQQAQMAATNRNLDKALDKALEPLELAQPLFLENRFIPLQMAHIHGFRNQTAQASGALAELPDHWSRLYHPNIPAVTAEVRQQLKHVAAPKVATDD